MTRILLTNDDGINAPGLAVLEGIAKTVSDDITIVAPEIEQSGKSRAVTLTEPIRLRQTGERSWAVSGTPSDCVLLALREIMDAPPDLLMSGVNKGQNIAEDTSYSGTIAAALCGMQHGVPSAALSQSQNFRGPGSCPWHTAEHWGPRALAPMLEQGWPSNTVININFPDREPDKVAGIQSTRQGFRDEQIIRTEKRTDLRGNDYFWIGYRGRLSNPDEGTDLRAIYDGYVSVSPLHIDLTDHGFLESMPAWTT
ncbi:MAG: 5'/3'-nucleotidase SurE [Pseudomonadota bacterium]